MRIIFVSMWMCCLALVNGLAARQAIRLTPLEVGDSTGAYSFFAGGHLYGAHDNKQSIFPAASFASNISRIQTANPDLFIGLGDIVRTAKNDVLLEAFQSVISQLDMPFYNAVGNHDGDDIEAYSKYFGGVKQAFLIGEDLFLILPAEELLGDESAAFLDFVEAVGNATFGNPPRNLFVFTHRNLPAAVLPELEPMDALANESFKAKADGTALSNAFEAVSKLPHKGEFWWFSGDVGTNWSVPLLYGKAEGHDLNVVAVGVGDTGHDALANVKVDPDGKVEVVPFALGEDPFGPLELYNAEYWLANGKGEEGSGGWRERIEGLLRQNSFWAGLAVGLMGTFLLFFVGKRLRQKR